MDGWLQDILRSDASGIIMLIAAFVFGLSAAVTTAGCGGLPAMLVILGFSSSTSKAKRMSTLLTATASFALSTVLLLGAMGALVSFVGGGIMDFSSRVGFYFKKVLGLGAVTLGVASLGLIPLRFPSLNLTYNKLPSGALGAIILGATVGLAKASCATTCTPLQMPIVITMAVLRGKPLDGFFILVMFGLGFVLPMVAIMLGVGLTRALKFLEKFDKPLKYVTGAFLLFIGLWLCLMFRYTWHGI